MKTNIAVIGKGKTGKFIPPLLSSKNISFSVFDQKTPITKKSLETFTHAIVFIPGESFLKIIPTLLESNLFVITGSTGFTWPFNIDQELKDKNISWIQATNFALGMNLIKQLLKTMSLSHKLFEKFDFKIHEVHHTKKLDAPSGTALSWAEWIEHPSKITSERTGDIVGDHQLIFETENEIITIRHQAKDRSIFASGAIWALENINILKPGLNQFSKMSLDLLLKE